MNPYTTPVVLFSLLLGTSMTFMSSHWLLAWMGLEINTLAILPMMIKTHHPRATEATTKYFLTQAAASALILFSTLMNAWTTGQWELKELSPLPSNMLTIALMMKLGVAPMHFWLPEVLQGVDLTTGLIISTWQKLAPMSLMFMTYNLLNPNLLMLLGFTSILLGGWLGLNQTQLRKIMASSSIAHLGWMMMILPLSPTLFILNIIIYITMTTAMFLSMKFFNVTKLNALTTSWSKTPILAISSSMVLLSLGGLPPTTGFMPKWLILQEMTKQHFSTTATIMAISALLSLFFYLRLSYSLALTQSPNTINSSTMWRFKLNHMTFLMSMTMTLSLLLLPLTPTLTLM
uniref:NADH-ubiquinone oxidoreductase chain 2 n=1 Tax=Hypogeophis rostratus TaxID=8450 RepID=C9D8H3_HYPRS|nr:NADH dehydrogenase subunit 2 [Hypogeophis rostratus]ACS37106.1 NADH dehydrogenase subunit 2 [Hypogeophis rostratus]